jgi:sec-independent protein translocase protein TatB
MFDFAFSELVVICVVALVVLGPTRLPGLVRKVGRWVGKARAMARDFREQLENEVNLDELSRATRQQPAAPTPAPPAPTAYQAEESAASAPAESGSPENFPADPQDFSGYPYGTPTDLTPTSTSSGSADPAVVRDGPQPGDDDYSHAHAYGAPPEPWNPEPEPQPEHQGSTEPVTESGKPAA